MPELTTCPSCSKQLRVPDELIGKGVKCPTCGATFTAQPTGSAAPPPLPSVPPPPPVPEVPEPMGRPAQSRQVPMGGQPLDDYGEEAPRRRPRPNYAPHRGVLVLVLGILSIVLQCFPLGIVAWVLGNGDLKKIRAREMDPEGEGLTKAGWICGIIGTFLGVFVCCVGGIVGFVNAMAQQGAFK